LLVLIIVLKISISCLERENLIILLQIFSFSILTKYLKKEYP